MKVHNAPIPDGKLDQFDEILKACGGRYLHNPIEAQDNFGRWRVSYEYEDMTAFKEHERRWERVTHDIVDRKRITWRQRIRQIFKMCGRKERTKKPMKPTKMPKSPKSP